MMMRTGRLRAGHDIRVFVDPVVAGLYRERLTILTGLNSEVANARPGEG
jgi:hypothetical protein